MIELTVLIKASEAKRGTLFLDGVELNAGQVDSVSLDPSQQTQLLIQLLTMALARTLDVYQDNTKKNINEIADLVKLDLILKILEARELRS